MMGHSADITMGHKAEYGRYDYGYLRLNSFHAVEKLYKDTKPINERNVGTIRDIRPIDNRKRKWERVHKFSDNCYGLFDGGIGDPYGWMANYINKNPDTSMKKGDAKIFAPILWTRDKNGTERLRIRNETGEGQHTSRYGFLQFAMPLRLDLLIKNGKQFVHQRGSAAGDVGTDGESYYLPKGKRVPGYANDYAKRFWHGDRQFTPDHVEVILERVPLRVGYEVIGSQFKLVSEPHRLPRALVDKETKKKHKDVIESFWEWLCAIAPMLPVHDWEYIKDSMNELRGYIAGTGHKGQQRWGYGGMNIPANIALRIMKDHNHSQRLNMVVNFLSSASYHYATDTHQGLNIQTAEDKKQFRANYNRWINKTLNLVKVS